MQERPWLCTSYYYTELTDLCTHTAGSSTLMIAVDVVTKRYGQHTSLHYQVGVDYCTQRTYKHTGADTCAATASTSASHFQLSVSQVLDLHSFCDSSSVSSL
jgi:hypothetical protein